MKNQLTLSFAFLLIIFVISQSGCVKDNNEYPDVTASADTIFGTLNYKQTDKLVAWPFGTANIKAIVGISDVLASAVVNTDGTFMLILPGTVSGSFLSSLANVSDQQGGTIVTTPETVRFLETIQYKVEYTENGNPASLTVNLHTLKSDLTVDKSYFYNFYDQDGTFIGTGAPGSVFKWTFTKGWGMVETYILNSTSGTINSKSVGGAPDNAIWVN